jgi:hypothetical protein
MEAAQPQHRRDERHTSRQPHVQLGLQRCPVRGLFRGGIEVPAATAVYAAWQRTVLAMHAHTKVAVAAGLCSAVGAPGAAPAVVEPELEPVLEPVAEPVLLVLRPFRSHVIAKSAEVEFCMQCCMRTPRHLANRWKAGCCDGRAPIGACPRYILAAISISTAVWPAGHVVRGRELEAAAGAFRSSMAAKALRPPKRRQPRQEAGQARVHRRA